MDTTKTCKVPTAALEAYITEYDRSFAALGTVLDGLAAASIAVAAARAARDAAMAAYDAAYVAHNAARAAYDTAQARLWSAHLAKVAAGLNAQQDKE